MFNLLPFFWLCSIFFCFPIFAHVYKLLDHILLKEAMTSTQILREIFSLIISQFDGRKTQKKTDSGVGLEKRKNNLRKIYANYFNCPPSAQRHFVITFMCACGAPRSGSLSLRLLRYASTPLTGWSPRARYAKAALPIAYWLPSFFVNFTKVDTVLFIYVRLLICQIFVDKFHKSLKS